MGTEKKERVSPAGNIDLANCKNGVIRIVGWAFWSESNPRAAKVSLRSASEPHKKVPLPIFPDPRPDVNEYLGIDAAVETGFSGRFSLNSISIAELPVGLAEIVATDPKGEFEDRVIGTVSIEWPEAPYQVKEPNSPEDSLEVTPEKVMPRGFFSRMWNGAAGGNADLLKLIDEEAFTAKNLLRSFQKIDSGINVHHEKVSKGILGLAMRLKQASQNDGLIIIIDHNYGGGANTFSNKLSSRHIATGNGVLRVWHTVADGMFGGEYITQSEKVSIGIDSVNDLFQLLSALPSFAIQLNSIWTYPETYQFLDNVLRLRLFGYTKRLEFFAHDHMPVCPSLFLLNHKTVFCGVPDELSKCKTCLRRNKLGFKSYYSETDIEAWRTAWQSLLLNCDFIRFFSNSTLENYARAYPWLADNPNVRVEGHYVADLWPVQYDRKRALANKSSDEGLKIAVFGFISEHKGSGVLKAISDAIMKKKDNTRILVFGSLDGRVYGKSGAIELMGAYAPVDMLDMCEDNGVDIAFMPSICPETFSFSTKELTLVGVPIASFELGGQGDIVKNYEYGHIITRGTGLSMLRQFHAISKAGYGPKAVKP